MHTMQPVAAKAAPETVRTPPNVISLGLWLHPAKMAAGRPNIPSINPMEHNVFAAGL
uniref:Uncharacterized protein n=1 Tax=Arion vulgaris TaxID=1028688 RepID=A0A0B6ZUM3_9EUPU